MGRPTTNHTHGSTGTKPDDGTDFESGDVAPSEAFDWLFDTTPSAIDSLSAEFDRLDSDDDGVVDEADYANDADASTFKGNDIDSDGDGTVDSADTAQTVKGNDIDSDGDGVVDEADNANRYKGNDIDSDGDGTVDKANDANTVGGESPSAFADTNHGNEEHSSDFTTLTEVNNNADVPNADYADSAGDADTVDGNHASDIAGGTVYGSSPETLSSATVTKEGSHSDSTEGLTDTAVVTFSFDDSQANNDTDEYDLSITYNGTTNTTTVNTPGFSHTETMKIQASSVQPVGQTITGEVVHVNGEDHNWTIEISEEHQSVPPHEHKLPQ